MTKIIREIFIILFICMIVIFTIVLLFYDCIPHKNETIESIEYVADKKVTETIKEIEANNSSDVVSDKDDSLLKSYSIGKDDLNEFVSENYYETGKKDPFAEYSTSVEEEAIKTVTTVTTGNSTNVQAENKKVENTTKEEVKKSSEGKYTENKNSK